MTFLFLIQSNGIYIVIYISVYELNIKKSLSIIHNQIGEIIQSILRSIPGKLGIYIRSKYYGSIFIHYGEDAFIRENVVISHRQEISIGFRSGINTNCWISAHGGLDIGKNVLIGPFTIIHTGNHNFSDSGKPINQQGQTFKKITIEDDVWIGANVIILSGVTIKEGSVIGAGSVVTKDVPPYSVMAGNPARLIKSRKNPDIDADY